MYISYKCVYILYRDCCFLSLNGKEPLDERETLASLNIVSGDLLHVICHSEQCTDLKSCMQRHRSSAETSQGPSQESVCRHNEWKNSTESRTCVSDKQEEKEEEEKEDKEHLLPSLLGEGDGRGEEEMKEGGRGGGGGGGGGRGRAERERGGKERGGGAREKGERERGGNGRGRGGGGGGGGGRGGNGRGRGGGGGGGGGRGGNGRGRGGGGGGRGRVERERGGGRRGKAEREIRGGGGGGGGGGGERRQNVNQGSSEPDISMRILLSPNVPSPAGIDITNNRFGGHFDEFIQNQSVAASSVGSAVLSAASTVAMGLHMMMLDAGFMYNKV